MFRAATAKWAAYRESKVVVGQDGNNNAWPKSRNGPAKRGRGGAGGGGHRASQQRATPPPSSQLQASTSSSSPTKRTNNHSTPPLMRPNPFSSAAHHHHHGENDRRTGATWHPSPSSSSHNYHQNRHPRIERSSQASRKRGGGAPRMYNALRPMKNALPPNENHMVWLNDQLRQFSYGTEDMYQEMPMPDIPPPANPMKTAHKIPKSLLPVLTPPASRNSSVPAAKGPPSSSNIPTSDKKSSVPQVPPNTMYIFRKQYIYDEYGVEVKNVDTTSVVHLTGEQVIFVDLDDELQF